MQEITKEIREEVKRSRAAMGQMDPAKTAIKPRPEDRKSVV